MGHYTNQILRNAEKINELKNKVDKTAKERDLSAKKRKEWEKACEEFHEQYNELAFPGGAYDAYERIIEGEEEAMEAALCFVECRPYFFRSGYMYKDILRKLKKAPLKRDQIKRRDNILEAFNKYKERKNA